MSRNLSISLIDPWFLFLFPSLSLVSLPYKHPWLTESSSFSCTSSRTNYIKEHEHIVEVENDVEPQKRFESIQKHQFKKDKNKIEILCKKRREYLRSNLKQTWDGYQSWWWWFHFHVWIKRKLNGIRLKSNNFCIKWDETCRRICFLSPEPDVVFT